MRILRVSLRQQQGVSVSSFSLREADAFEVISHPGAAMYASEPKPQNRGLGARFIFRERVKDSFPEFFTIRDTSPKVRHLSQDVLLKGPLLPGSL